MIPTFFYNRKKLKKSTPCGTPTSVTEPGTRITVPEFFNALDYDNNPELNEVKHYADCSMYQEATDALASYFRNRPTSKVNWWFDPHDYSSDDGSYYYQSEADDALGGKITVKGITYQFDYDNPGSVEYHIDWLHTESATNEWNWQLNRMSWWRMFGWIYWARRYDGYSSTDADTRKYAEQWVNQIKKWLGQVPRPDDDGAYHPSAWRTIEAGSRLHTYYWPDQFNRFLHAPEFTNEMILYFLMGIYDHQVHLHNYHGSGNWLMTENYGRFLAGALFPEIANSSVWRSEAISSINSEIDNQFYTQGDGCHYAQSGSYGIISLEDALAMYNHAQLFGREDEFPDNYVDELELECNFYVSLMTPDGLYPQKNDGASDNLYKYFGGDERTYNWADLFPSRSDFLWIKTQGASGSPPSFLSYDNTWSGYVVFRDSWDDDSNYILIDAGDHFGRGPHRHGDINSITVYSHGIEVLYDGDGGLYDSTLYRDYAQSAYSHNTVIVDSMTQTSDVEWTDYATSAGSHVTDLSTYYDYVRHTYTKGYALRNDPYGAPSLTSVDHMREVLYLKDISAALVVDHMLADSNSHKYEARFHMNDIDGTIYSGDTSSGWVGIGSSDGIGLGVLAIKLNSNSTMKYYYAHDGSYSRDIYGYAYLDGPGFVAKPEAVHELTSSDNTVLLTILFMTDSTGGSYSALIDHVAVIDSLSANVYFQDNSHMEIEITSNSSYGMTVRLYNTSGTLYRTITI